ncbi:MAG: exosortase U [Isosphaeraceae bacterium]
MASSVSPPLGASARGPSTRTGSWLSAWPALIVVLSFVPLLAVHSRLLWARPHYQFFPLVVPGALALAYRYCRGLGELRPGSVKVARWLWLAGWALLAFSVIFVSTTASAVAFLVTLLAAIYAMGGGTLVRAALPAWAFLWLAVPFPRTIDLKIITGLQDLVSIWSSQILDTLKVFHLMEGNVVEIPDGRLLVDQACSGIYSLLTLMLGTLFYVLWNKSGWVRGALLMASAIFWVILGNVARIVAIVILKTRFEIDATAGKKHEALGIGIFVLMLVMVWSSDKLFSFFATLARGLWAWIVRGRQTAAAAEIPVEAAPTVLPAPTATWLSSIVVALAFVVWLLPQFLLPGVNWREVLIANDVYGPKFEKLGEASFPARWRNLERMGFTTQHRKMDDSWGENSRIWVYRQGPRVISVSLDYQFVDWHELAVCYGSQGWTVAERRIEPLPEGGPRSIVVLDMVSPQGWYGYLVYGLYRSDGRPVTPPEGNSYLQGIVGRISGWFRPNSRETQAVASLSYQVQVFVESEAPLTPSDRETMIAFHQAVRETIRTNAFGKGD